MVRKYKTLVGLVLIALILFTTCKTRENGKQELYHNKTFKKADNLPLAGTEVNIDSSAALKINGLWNESMSQFYASHNYKAAWLTNRQLNKNGEDLFNILNSIWEDGLIRETYNYSYLEDKLKEYTKLTLQEKDSLSFATILDIELSKTYFLLADNIANGQVDPSSFDTVWQTYPKVPDLAAYLLKAVNKKEVKKAIENLKPKSEQYELLKHSYVKLLKEKENINWPVPGYYSEKLEENDTSLQVVNVKRFLAVTGDLQNTDTAYLNADLYDNTLTEAVRKFQERHGLYADGIIGKATLTEMNQPLEKRLNQIRVNLDRLRRLPDDLGEEYIAVNIPGFSLKYVKNDKLVNNMNIVVGSNKNATPVLKDTLSYIVFNPEWNVPTSIATKEILPKAKADPTYLVRNNYKVLPYAGASSDVDWSKVSATDFPYRIIQKSGNGNALGIVKFIMPNQHSIYLHDTPSKALFNRAKRNFSHGCIRLSEPVKLAEDLLAGQLSRNEIDKILASRETTKVVLENQIPVHMFYQTAWVDENGQLQFRDDIYKHDQLVLAEMQKYADQNNNKILLAENN